MKPKRIIKPNQQHKLLENES